MDKLVKTPTIISKAKYAITDIYSIFWTDLRIMRRNRLRTLATSLVNPLLYLVAFGYGLGRGVNFDGVNYLTFVIPGLVAMTTMTSSFNGAGTKLNVDRLFHKCFDELLMSPFSLFSIVVGKAMIGVVRGLISSAALLIMGLFISPSLVISPFFVLTVLLSCFAFSFLGVLVALLAKSHQDMNVFNAMVMVPMTFLCGTFFSLSQLPEAVKAALYVFPLTHVSQCLRASALGQAFPWLSFAALLSFGLAFLTGGIVVLKKSSV